jgi:ribose 5-phosphate isomerase A
LDQLEIGYAVTIDEMKIAAAEAAADLIEPGMSVGLGSGSTARAFVHALGRRVNAGLKINAVASSITTAKLACQFGIPLGDLDGPLDIAVDGADAVARRSLSAIKGLGGALTRERIVAEAARQFVLIVDETKLCDRLDQTLDRIAIPVAIVPFGSNRTLDRLSQYGEPELRLQHDGSAYQTDEGNYIVDLRRVRNRPLNELANELKLLTGIVDHGLFIDLATHALVGTQNGVVSLVREN